MVNSYTTETKKKEIHTLISRILPLIEDHPFRYDDLSMGKTAVAVSYFYYGSCFDKDLYQEKGMQLINEVFEGIDGEKSILSKFCFYNGLTGFMNTLQHLNDHGFLELDFDEFKTLDKLLFDWSMEQLELGNNDFLVGAMGTISYFSDRLPDPDIENYLVALVNSIILKSEATDHYALLNLRYNKLDKRKSSEINYSLAHGMSSVLLCFIKLYEKGFQQEQIKAYLNKAITYYLSINEKQKSPGHFIGSIYGDTDEVLYQKRLGWCFSDLNLIQVFLKAGILFKEEKWLEMAHEGTLQVTKRKSYEETLIDDPFLCHGALGVACYYNSLFLINSNPLYVSSRDYWLEKGLLFFREKDDTYFTSKEYTQKADIHSLLYGLTGTLLCLISLYDSKYINWSKIVLL